MPQGSSTEPKVIIVDRAAVDLRQLLAADFPAVQFWPYLSPDEAIENCSDAEVLIGTPRLLSNELLTAMPKLRLIQLTISGTDQVAWLKRQAPQATIASVRGIHGPQMAELAILMMLALPRRLPDLIAHQRAKIWEKWPQPLMRKKTVTIIGIGTVAKELAQMCCAFGMRVVGVSRSPREISGFHQLYGRDRMIDAVREADFVVILAAYESTTHHLIDHQVLGAMRPTAYLINLSRGSVVDEQALLEALTDNKLGGVGLDVFAVEPLPPDHPLWDAPNTLLTPHIGGFSDIYVEQITTVIRANLVAFFAGRTADIRNAAS